jgi:hypothetical protein
VQLCGVGTKRQRQLAQQKLFAETAESAASMTAAQTAEMEPAMDETDAEL